MEPLNVAKLQFFIDMGRINANEPITLKVLKDSGIVGRIKHGVKLLGDVCGLVLPNLIARRAQST